MPYKPLSLPRGLDTHPQTIIHEHVDPYLCDVHNMFLLPLPHERDRNAAGGCNLPIASTLIGVLAGISVLGTPDAKRNQSGRLFKELIECYYPDESSIPGAVAKNDLAKALWELYRCPLEHSLGTFDAETRATTEDIFGRGAVAIVRVDKGRLDDGDISSAEDAADRGVPAFPDQGPTLRIDGDELRLTARVFYWGVRQTVIKWAEAQNQRTNTTQQEPTAIMIPSYVTPGSTEVGSGSTSATTAPSAFPNRVELGST